MREMLKQNLQFLKQIQILEMAKTVIQMKIAKMNKMMKKIIKKTKSTNPNK